MTSKVILKKKNTNNTFGYLGIRFFNGKGEKKVISLGERIEQTDFDKFFDSEFNLFKKTTKIDYKLFNTKINDKINDFSIFDNKINKQTTKSFLTYFNDYLELIPNQNTKDSFGVGLKKLEEFKTHKKYNDILFSQIDNTFVKELKNYFLTQLSGNTTIQYLNIIKVVLNSSKRDGLYSEKFNYFSKLNIKKTYSNKKILTENDIKILLGIKRLTTDFEKKNKYFDTRNMLLFSVFSSGLRVSDLLLIRNKDFKSDYIEVITKKTSLSMRIDYNDKLLGLLTDIYDSEKLYSGVRNMLSKEQKRTQNIDFNKHKLLEHIKSLPPNDFMFSEFMSLEPSLIKYSKLKEMTIEQNSSLNRLRGIYNYSLKEMIKRYDLEIEQISSHTGRYSWTNLLLNIEGVNLVDIQRSLGHKRLSTTEQYIEKNFNKDRLKNIGTKLSDKISDLEI